MSTPVNMVPADGTSTQKSSTQTYSQAIEMLQNADSRLASIAASVETLRSTLLGTYGGVDGQAYAQVIQTWLDEVSRIRNTCQAMQNQLNTSMQTSNQTQNANFDAVNAQTRLTPFGGSPVAAGAFNTMTA